MAPTLIYRFAHQNDFKQGIFSCNYPSSLKSKLKADMANSTTWCRGTLDGSRMPNSAGEPDFESSIYTDDIRFGCTQAQYEEWWSDKDHIEAEKRQCVLYTVLACGQRWIGNAQVLFDSSAALIMQKGYEREW